MRINKGWLIAGFLPIGGLACLWGVGCDDEPTKSKPVEPKDYPVYMADRNRPMLFTYHPMNGELDSAQIDWQAERGITASADGKLLYLATRNTVVVIDASSHELVAELPYEPRTPVAVSPDNQLLGITGDDIFILRTSDYTEVFSDTDRSENGCFSRDSRTFYCSGGLDSTGTRDVLYKVELSDDSNRVERHVFADGGVIQAMPSQDETKLFLYLAVSLWTDAFEVYDVTADSIIFNEPLIPGGGMLGLTPNGLYAIYTSPGANGADPAPIAAFYIYDVLRNRIHDTVGTTPFQELRCVCAPNELATTPDGRWLILLGGMTFGQSVLYRYDLKNDRLVEYINLLPILLGNPTVASNE